MLYIGGTKWGGDVPYQVFENYYFNKSRIPSLDWDKEDVVEKFVDRVH